MQDCFIFTYKELKRKGVELPTKFGKYQSNNFKDYLKDLRQLREDKEQYKFFDSFCTVVTDDPKEYDIAVSDTCIGIVLNKFKFVTIKESNKNKSLENITKDFTIYRVGKVETKQEVKQDSFNIEDFVN